MEYIGLLVLIWFAAEAFNWLQNDKKRLSAPEDLNCPVCGYLCLGKGGIGCIDKPSWVKRKKPYSTPTE